MKRGHVYMLANTSCTLYTGITSDLRRRIWQHQSCTHDGFTKRYNVTRFVWFAEFSRIEDAIAFGKSLKGKSPAKKVALIEESNPRWNDLAWNGYPAGESASRGNSSLRSE